MTKEDSKNRDNDPFASFADILEEMVSAGYGFEEIMQTMKDLGLSEAEAGLLVELNVEKQIPKVSGKIERMVKEKIEKHVKVLKEKLKRRVESRKRRTQKELDLIHSQVSKALMAEFPEKNPIFEKRYFAYLLVLNQADIERKELLAFLEELDGLKASRKTKSKVLSAIRILNDL
ncbi:MAG: hypothetical protein Q7R70_00725 [Candidatus Diapherotrites archaeon]|nr:hypothetical protein [Candidatus Diapherotrites archaeon]